MAGRVILRKLRIVVLAAGSLALLAFCLIQVQQRILRHRAESLMADIHRIRLHRTDWNQAQALMKRWGKWGHYDGTCTAADCLYSITLEDPGWALMRRETPRKYLVPALHAYRWLGGRLFSMRVQFIVQDGTIWRTGVGLAMDVPPNEVPDDEFGYTLLIRTRARETLRDDHRKRDFWVLGNEEQLARHPNYKLGRPSGCEGCLSAEVTYTPDSDPAEIRRLTTFDFSCLTRVSRCTSLEDIFPAARERRLYTGIDCGATSRINQVRAIFKDVNAPAIPVPGAPDSMQPLPCDIPVWALGRDTTYALVVDALSSGKHEQDGWIEEWTNVRIVEQLKGHVSSKPGTVLRAYSFDGEFRFPPLQMPEPLVPGKRYIVLPPQDVGEQEPKLVMHRCGVLDDTPQVRSELQKGAALNDHLRQPEIDFAGFPWQ